MKQATLFSDVKITAQPASTEITITKQNPTIVNYKGDNFAKQITIFSNTPINIWEYHYITFDNQTFFQITNTIINDGNYTLFIEYVSRLKRPFEQTQIDLYPTAVTTKKLHSIGIDINRLLEAIGQAELSNENLPLPPNVSIAIRAKFSEIPANAVSERYPASVVSIFSAPHIDLVSISDNPDNQFDKETLKNRMTNAMGYVGYLIVPQIRNVVGKTNGEVSIFTSSLSASNVVSMQEYSYEMVDFIRQLAFLSDLTLTAEITLIDNNSIICWLMGSSNIYMNVTLENDNITLPKRWVRTDRAGLLMRLTTTAGANGYAFWIMFGEQIQYDESMTYQYIEVLNEITLPIAQSSYKLTQYIKLFGQTIEYQNKNGDSKDLIIKRENGYLRVYTDKIHNIYTDIYTDFEFLSSELSNFLSYKKANQELAFTQNLETQKLIRMQERDANTRNMISGLGNNVARGAITGSGVGIAAGVVSSVISAITTVAEENANKQNDIVNYNLQLKQLTERGNLTILPAKEIKGATFISKIFEFTHTYIPLTDLQKKKLHKYMIDNLFTELVPYLTGTYLTDYLNRPDFFIDNIFIVKIEDTNPTNNFKPFYIRARY